MSQPLPSDTLRTILRDELNDRFEHYEKRQDQRHQEIMHGFGQVVDTLADHIDERTRKLAEYAGHPELATANF